MGNRPTAREKVRLTIDQPKLQALALHYVGRYATTQAKLRHYLERKLRERLWVGDAAPDIDTITNHCVERNYVDDHSFAVARASALSRRGYGAVRVNGALRQAGIDAQASHDISAVPREEALAVALHFAKRKSIGPFSRAELNERTRQRMMSALVRAGHSFEVARSILLMQPEDVADSDVAL
jgi:regulatory protein